MDKGVFSQGRMDHIHVGLPDIEVTLLADN